MDRTAWIIIGICAALLGLNIYMGNNKKAEPAPIPAPQAAAAAALHRTAALLRRRGGHDHGPCHGVYYTRIYTL